jgi:hypothetical protein
MENGHPLKVVTGSQRDVDGLVKSLNRLDAHTSRKREGYRCRTRIYHAWGFEATPVSSYDPLKPYNDEGAADG